MLLIFRKLPLCRHRIFNGQVGASWVLLQRLMFRRGPLITQMRGAVCSKQNKTKAIFLCSSFHYGKFQTYRSQENKIMNPRVPHVLIRQLPAYYQFCFFLLGFQLNYFEENPMYPVTSVHIFKR